MYGRIAGGRRDRHLGMTQGATMQTTAIELSTLEVTPGGVIEQAKPRSRVKSITITRIEGEASEIDEWRDDGEGFKERTVESFVRADTILRRMAATAPDDGTYNKVDFVVTWANGDNYQGTYDLKRHDTGHWQQLQRQIRGFLRYLVGEFKPDHMTQEEYNERLAGRPEEEAQARHMLDTLDLS